MGKKWWYLVFIFLFLAVAVFISATFLKNPVQKLQGGVVIVSPGASNFPGSPSSSASASTNAPKSGKDPAATDNAAQTIMNEGGVEIPPEPRLDGGCWKCPEGGIILNMALGELTDFFVQNMTNCTNATQLIQVDCSLINPLNQTKNATCGDGFCEGNETAENCPADCTNRVDGEGGAAEDSSGETTTNNNVRNSPSSDTTNQEIFGGEYHSECTTKTVNQPSKCVILKGPGESQCKIDSDCTNFVKKTEEKPRLSSPTEDSFLESLIKMMFGLPPGIK